MGWLNGYVRLVKVILTKLSSVGKHKDGSDLKAKEEEKSRVGAKRVEETKYLNRKTPAGALG